MSTPQRNPSMESQDSNIRKRVCKACDRCRLKKSKCDGSNPCSRCKADNAICVFGERKKSHDKVYPKGYVEMLEQQQTQLVAGLRELYSRLQSGSGWPGSPLEVAQGGHPLTHDILERLDLLRGKSEDGTHYEGFEEDCSRMQQRLLQNGASYVKRRGSVSSDSSHDHDHASTISSYGTPPTQNLPLNDSFARNGAPPTPPLHSPFPRQSQLSVSVKASPQFSVPYMRAGMDPAQIMRPNWTIEPQIMDDNANLEYGIPYDSPMQYEPPMTAFEQFPSQTTPISTTLAMDGWTDSSDLDFSNFINPIAT
ncbi:hypothetical protein M501DRAFT_940855 [Patellaria atrata CBS 101060]|uniref:Zn(2)-C6 fungal-type domain-containing protein n=1 Tax=Patellaria atrata CBS 101060 TaxID=1346257 RepID=A0A9P4S613_9PEZI|nr:hypothetical protein M501DRAFT_940855 [Patellaria atrata CBS 101060]